MADVKWIKITTDIFDDEKILLIETLPEADSLIVIWFKLLCLAGKQNNHGVFLMNDRIPYTDKMLATIFRRSESVVQLALTTFEQFGMIERVEGVITIPNWSKHQNLDQLEARKEYMSNYMKDYRQKQKALIGTSKYNAAGLNMQDWKSVLEEFDYSCAYCGSKEGLEQDHLIPFSDGGTTTIDNIVPACRRCNASKQNKDVIEWYKNQDFYDEEKCKHLRKRLRKHFGKSNVNEADKIREDKNRLEEDKKRKRDASADEAGKMIEEFSSDNSQLKDSLWAFYEMRKRIKKPLNPYAMKLILNKLREFSDDPAVQVQILNESIVNNWQSVYPLKERKAEPMPKGYAPQPTLGSDEQRSLEWMKQFRARKEAERNDNQ